MSFLPGSERFSRPKVQNQNPRIELANLSVPIVKLLKDLWGVFVPEGMGFRSWKTFCPLGWEHPDGGIDKGFRVYESTNSSYCFVMHGSLTPVRLAQIKWGGSQDRSARRLLELYGLGRRPWRERYEELLELYERSKSPAIQSNVVEALQVRLSSEPSYWRLQFEASVIKEMEHQLELLDELFDRKPSEEQIREWYSNAVSKLVQKVREVDHNAPG